MEKNDIKDLIMIDSSFKLSSEDYWNKVLSEAKLPRINSDKIYNYKITMDFIHNYLSNKDYKTFLEVGCGSSGWLPYFYRKYGYEVSGVDYSEIGCRLCIENLRILNIPYGDIFCKDLFDENCTEGKKYDVIFTYGVIEHFNDPEIVIRSLITHLNPNGLVITLVPNLNGFNGFLSRVFVNDVYKMHKVIIKNELKRYHKNNNLREVISAYVGIFSMAVIPWMNSKTWLFKEYSWRRKFFLYIIFSGFGIIERMFMKFPSNYFSSKFLSPYIISIFSK